MRRRVPLVPTALCAAALIVGGAGTAGAGTGEEPPVDGETEQEEVVGADAEAPPERLPLIPVPTGCEAPKAPHIVFVGEVTDRDFRTVRFRIESIRSGRADPFARDGKIDVRFGLDAQYLDDGDTYLVSAVADDDLGLLVSRVTDAIEDFGGDDVIGVSETDVECPELEDPMRTLHLDGTVVEAGVLEPFFGARVRIMAAFLIPALVAIGLIFVLATFRLSIAGMYRSVTGADRGDRA